MSPFYELQTKSSVSAQILEIAHNSEPWTTYFDFRLKVVPSEIFLKDEFLTWLSRGYVFHAAVLKLDPYTCYDWHTDTNRGVSVNMLLNPDIRSYCLFSPNRGLQTDDDIDGDTVFNIEELSYKASTYYLFNTQVQHTIYNFEDTRYLFSVEFSKDKNKLTFCELLKDVQNNFVKNLKAAEISTL